MNIKMIPLSKLVPSRTNVRKTGTSIGIDELAASIAAHGTHVIVRKTAPTVLLMTLAPCLPAPGIDAQDPLPA